MSNAPLAAPVSAKEISTKSYSTAIVLALLFGVLGVHHLYLRRWGEAALDWGLTITALVLLESHPLAAVLVFLLDIAHTAVTTSLLIVGKWRDGEGRLVAYPGQFPQLPPTS